VVCDPGNPNERYSPWLLKQVEAICRVFEQAWNTSSRVSVEQLLLQNTELPRSLLLHELLCREIGLLNNERECCPFSQYQRRFPDDDDVLKAIFENRDSPSLGHWIANAVALPATVFARDVQVASEQSRDGRCPDFPGYQVSKVIGQGGMGVVYLGLDVKSKR